MLDTARHRAGSPLSYRFVLHLVSRTPHRALYLASRAGGFLHYLLSADKRRSYMDNLSLARGRRVGKPWKAFQNHALNVLELLKAPSEDSSEVLKRVIIHGRQHLDASLKAKSGLVLLTFHSGNWEISGLALALQGYPITTVAGEQLRDGWSEDIKQWKRRRGIKVLSPGQSMREMYRDLEEGRIVVLHIDGNVFSYGIKTQFMGKSIYLPGGAVRLSRMTGAAIGIAYCRRRGRDHLDVFIREALPAPRSAQAEMDMMNRLAREIEKCILEEPEQWCIFRRL